ncbi:MAG TPA: ABC transporter substrate-binding protein [Stellaceae bacterium]|nr:ABC transporter substrate-binding protein [Stellaceae bacterium]
MTRHLAWLAMAGVVAAPLALWQAPAQAATPRDTVVMAKKIDDIITLDPGEAYELSGEEIVTNVYDRLIRFEAEDLTKMVGGVAASWTISDDSKTFTFKLRPGQKFQDTGSTLTAEDAAFSLQRVILMDKTPAFLISQLGWTKDNVKDLVKALDPLTLQFTTPNKYAPSLVLNLMSSVVGSVVEKKVALQHEEKGDFGNGWLKTHTAASGPFKLISWKPNESVTLEANPTYRLGAPAVKRVIVRHIPEAASQALLLQKGDIDIARDLNPDQLKTLAGDKAIKVETFAGSDTYYAGMNLAYEPFKNPKVRDAMRYLIDYDGMVNSFLKGNFFVHQAFLPKGFMGAMNENEYKLDVAKAKLLLAEAGYPNGFEVRLDTWNSSPMAEIAQSMQQTMGMAGIKVNIVPAEQKQVLTIYRARKHQMAALSWGPDYLDPHTNADTFSFNPDNSDGAARKPLAWRNSWDIPELTKETEAAAQEPDSAKRETMYLDLQKKVMETGPFLIMFQPTFQVAERTNVKGMIAGITSDLTYYRKLTK